MLQYVENHGPPTGPHEPLGEKPRLHGSAHIRQSYLGNFTAVGAHSSMRESSMDDYSYLTSSVSCVWTTIGKFCSIAAQTG